MALRLSGRFSVSSAMPSLSWRVRVVKFIEFARRANLLRSIATSSARCPVACEWESPRRALSAFPIQLLSEDFLPVHPARTDILQDRRARNRSGGIRHCTQPLFFLWPRHGGCVSALQLQDA